MQKESLELFEKAEKLERQGNLHEALSLYRKAYKLNPELDHDLKQKRLVQQQQVQTLSAPDNSTIKKEDKIEEIDWSSLIQTFHEFHLQTEHPIVKLPREILYIIVKKLMLWDPCSVSQLGRVCKFFYHLTREENLWQYGLQKYFPNFILSQSQEKNRLLFLKTPRIRHEGVYISVCHYTRQGLSDCTFTQPIHLITYYRYLRFYKDGTIISLLTSLEPAAVIPLIKFPPPLFSDQPLTSKETQWRKGTFEFQPNERKISCVFEPHRSSAKLEFHLDLILKQQPSKLDGCWNKLIWKKYFSLDLSRQREQTDFNTQQFGPYYFSRVKSFT